jgi:4-amino-4-deoxychorismate lyase
MYSTWAGGIVTRPELMVLALDDHMVHRGDGVFEALRIVDGAVFDLKSHLNRLGNSARAIGLKLPLSQTDIAKRCIQTAKAAGLESAAIRIFVGRGPGSFSPNPYDSPKSQLYIAVTEYHALSEKKYKTGVRAATSRVPQKNGFFAQIKSCNYLPNVLMKAEAVDAGLDFCLGFDPDGKLLEGPTENIALIDREGRMLVPKFDYTLRGTTLITVIESLAREPLQAIRSVEMADIETDDLINAQEAFMVGTTLEVLPLVEFDGEKIGTGRPGPLAKILRERLQEEMRTNRARRHVVDLRRVKRR